MKKLRTKQNEYLVRYTFIRNQNVILIACMFGDSTKILTPTENDILIINNSAMFQINHPFYKYVHILLTRYYLFILCLNEA